MNQVELLLICGVVLFSHVCAQFGGPPEEDPSETTEDDIYPCYHDMHCVLGDEIYAEAEECHEIMNEEDMNDFRKFCKESGHDVGNKTPREMSDYFCPLDADVKKKLFDDVGGKMMKKMTDICKKNDRDDCDRMNEAVDCFANIIDRLKKEDKCGADKN